ncbi:MAG: 3-methyl-2-oxobutanoate hydroxymethyltransferase [bacterium]|nr:3-methyl-2-oxobutanoate hydroxymethyltransferase [bacterium]
MKSSIPTRTTVPSLLDRKNSKEKISVLTAYDFTMASLIDSAGIDIILVGDSLGCVIQGKTTTIGVELEEMIYHTKCVSKAIKNALLVADMPFMSYQISPEQAIESAGKLIKAGAAAVKLEGGVHMAKTVSRITEIDIPVMGHIGLTPQSYHRMGGNKVQGKSSGGGAGSREKIIEDAVALEKAGVFCIVIESVPSDLAQEITNLVSVPTIGIGAGAGCDGQVLVGQDMLGMCLDFSPRFLKRYAEIGITVKSAVSDFIKEVKEGVFPAKEHSFSSDPGASNPNPVSHFDKKPIFGNAKSLKH